MRLDDNKVAECKRNEQPDRRPGGPDLPVVEYHLVIIQSAGKKQANCSYSQRTALQFSATPNVIYLRALVTVAVIHKRTLAGFITYA